MPKSDTAGTARAAPGAAERGWAEAVRREAVIRPLAEEQRCSRGAVDQAAQALGLARSQTKALVRAFRANPVTGSLIPGQRGVRPGARVLPPAVEACIGEAMDAVFLKPERPSVAALVLEVARLCRARGLRPPARKAVSARVSATDLRIRIRLREGAAAARRLAPVTGRLTTERPLDVWQIDHTLADIQLVDDIARQPIGRPWLTLVLDVNTRMVAGLYVSLASPSAAVAGLAFAQAVLPKDDWLAERGIEIAWPVCGLPAVLHMDNAAEFRSEAFRRGLQQHGVRPEFRPVGRPHWGGHIERLMGTLMRRIHTAPGTTFASVAERGDYDADARAVLTLREFERRLAIEVLGPYHNEIHMALRMPPIAAWRERAAHEPRLPTERGRFFLDFLPHAERCVGREGVRLFNIHYQDGALAHLVGAGAGRLRVKYDPRDLSAVFVELPSGEHVRVPYADMGRPPITLWEHRRAERALRDVGRQSVDEHAIFAAVAEIRRQEAEATRLTRAARREAQREAHAAEATGRARQRPSSSPKRPPPESPPSADPEARVPSISDEDAAAVEFWS